MMFFGHRASRGQDFVPDSIPFKNRYSRLSVVVIRQIFLTMYHVHQTEIVCQSYDPEKLKHQFTQTGPIVGASSPRVRFLDIQSFPLFLNNKQAFEPHCNTVQRHVAATSLLRDKLPPPQLFDFHYVYKHIYII